MLYRRENIYDLNDILESEKFVSSYKNIKHLQQGKQKKKKKIRETQYFYREFQFSTRKVLKTR